MFTLVISNVSLAQKIPKVAFSLSITKHTNFYNNNNNLNIKNEYGFFNPIFSLNPELSLNNNYVFNANIGVGDDFLSNENIFLYYNSVFLGLGAGKVFKINKQISINLIGRYLFEKNFSFVENKDTTSINFPNVSSSKCYFSHNFGVSSKVKLKLFKGLFISLEAIIFKNVKNLEKESFFVSKDHSIILNNFEKLNKSQLNIGIGYEF